MLKQLFKFLSFALPLVLTGHRSSAFASDIPEASDSTPEIDELPEYNYTGLRELLTNAPTIIPTKAPTYAPNTITPYLVNNNASSGLYSFPVALDYVNSAGGKYNLTFGSGAYNKTCFLQKNVIITNPVTIDLTSLGSTKFIISGSFGINSNGVSASPITFCLAQTIIT